MRQITKDIEITIDGNPVGFRLSKLEHDTPSCMKLLLEGISWSLSGFFGEGQSRGPESGLPDTAR